MCLHSNFVTHTRVSLLNWLFPDIQLVVFKPIPTVRKYYRNNESKEEDKRKQYFGLRELKLQTTFSSLTSLLFFFHFFFFFFFELGTQFGLGACHKIRTKNKEHKRDNV